MKKLSSTFYLSSPLLFIPVAQDKTKESDKTFLPDSFMQDSCSFLSTGRNTYFILERDTSSYWKGQRI
jgi:hypothetical protein